MDQEYITEKLSHLLKLLTEKSPHTSLDVNCAYTRRYLQMFLLKHDFDCPAALEGFLDYHRFLRNYPELTIHADNLPQIFDMLDAHFVYLLPKASPRGSVIILHVGRVDFSQHTIQQVVLLMVCLLHISTGGDDLHNSFTIIFDLDHISMRALKKVTPRIVRMLTKIMQVCLQMNANSLYAINAPLRALGEIFCKLVNLGSNIKINHISGANLAARFELLFGEEYMPNFPVQFGGRNCEENLFAHSKQLLFDNARFLHVCFDAKLF